MILFFTQSRGGTSVLRLEEHIDRLILHPDRDATTETVPDELKPCLGVYLANFAAFESERFEVLYKNSGLAARHSKPDGVRTYRAG